MNVHIKIIPHDDQRYFTVGDWWYEADALEIRVSRIPEHPDYEFLVGYHELIEAQLCAKAGITEEQVTAFDVIFENERLVGLHLPEDEPGDDCRAPYRLQHVWATAQEKYMADALGVNWEHYEEILLAL